VAQAGLPEIRRFYAPASICSFVKTSKEKRFSSR
jgi:hypothetical protein